MTSFVKAVTWDRGDALRLAAFWAAALGRDADEEPTPDGAYVEAAGWGGPNMWFVRVPEGRAEKNRLHFDLRPMDRRMDEEVDRLSGLGATIAERFESHVTMRDPEG